MICSRALLTKFDIPILEKGYTKGVTGLKPPSSASITSAMQPFIKIVSINNRAVYYLNTEPTCTLITSKGVYVIPIQMNSTSNKKIADTLYVASDFNINTTGMQQSFAAVDEYHRQMSGFFNFVINSSTKEVFFAIHREHPSSFRSDNMGFSQVAGNSIKVDELIYLKTIEPTDHLWMECFHRFNKKKMASNNSDLTQTLAKLHENKINAEADYLKYTFLLEKYKRIIDLYDEEKVKVEASLTQLEEKGCLKYIKRGNKYFSLEGKVTFNYVLDIIENKTDIKEYTIYNLFYSNEIDKLINVLRRR